MQLQYFLEYFGMVGDTARYLRIIGGGRHTANLLNSSGIPDWSFRAFLL